MNRGRFSSPSSSSITNNRHQFSTRLISSDDFVLMNMLFSNGRNFPLAFPTFNQNKGGNAFFLSLFSFCSGEKNMRETTPVKEVCNVLPSGLMTPRDAAVYIGVKINTLAVWRMTNKYDLPFVKLGRVIRYRKTDLDEWIDKNLQKI